MKNDDKIRKYIEGEMTGEELSGFEKEIEMSAQLKETIIKYKAAIKNYRELSSLNPRTNYFNNIIPEFRKAVEKKKKISFSPAYTFGSFIVVVLMAFVFFFILNDEAIQPEIDFTESVSADEIEQFLTNYSADLSYLNLTNNITDYDELLDSLFTSELNITANNFDLQFDFVNTDINNFIERLSDEEFDGLYTSIMNKKF